MNNKTTPCPTCPWRKSNPPGGANIPGFRIELMRGLVNTVGKGDAFRPIFACHYSPCGEESVCVGYAAVEGYSNLSVRVMAARGKIPMRDILKACEGLDLWESFDEMLEAYEEANQ
jgi:hypothetical protein